MTFPMYRRRRCTGVMRCHVKKILGRQWVGGLYDRGFPYSGKTLAQDLTVKLFGYHCIFSAIQTHPLDACGPCGPPWTEALK